jgi:pyruvate/2-oxoglutarate dehydrogenase complex dihydrolipoamide acyltransferase (E2) component
VATPPLGVLARGENGPEEREYLPLTLSFDHMVVDGAPAARFATRLRGILEAESRLDKPQLLGRAT